MASHREPWRQQLFRELSANLARLRPEYAGQYVCPLCMIGGFTEADVLGPSPRLTEEHCIPNGLGTTISVLTCARCNNTAGMELDNELHKRVEWDAFCNAEQKQLFNVRLSGDGNNVGIEFGRTGGGNPTMNIKIIARQSNPADIKRLQEVFTVWKEGGATPNPIEVHFRANVLPRERLARIALLKAGYLLLFKRLGYYPITLAIFEPVRRQIRDFQSQELNVDSIVLRFPIESLPETICFMRTPGAVGVAVPVALSKYGVGYFVIMPINDSTYAKWDDFHRLNQESGTEIFPCELYPLNQEEIRENILRHLAEANPATE